MKKSIVLLITLFFISAISILILQNLKDTDDYLNTLTFDASLSQTQITMDNMMDEIPKYLKANIDNIDIILENSSAVPLNFENIDIVLNISEYEFAQFNINNLTQEQITSEDFVNNINYRYDFLEIVKSNKLLLKDKKYISQAQIQQTIREYVEETKDIDILNIKDDFTFLEDINNSRLIECNYILNANNTASEVSFIFDLNSTKIKDFNIINIF